MAAAAREGGRMCLDPRKPESRAILASAAMTAPGARWRAVATGARYTIRDRDNLTARLVPDDARPHVDVDVAELHRGADWEWAGHEGGR
jgi:hypothetical protein